MTDTTPSSDLKPHGNVVLVVVDIQGGGQPTSFGADKPGYMAGRPERNAKAVDMVARFRDKGVPVVFIQEVHKPSLVDIGREPRRSRKRPLRRGRPAHRAALRA
ncbi:hypothetical protein [Demequina litorisediminis]|uniref:hypothetical protein n=1 Tax=Demequina litorisediminis TaxID=1849022 RepID=UPI0024E0C21C|nr:hypothetical protein [Demequina litorisediminis]